MLHERDIRKGEKIKDDLVRSKYSFLKGETRKQFMDEISNFMTDASFYSFAILIDKNEIPQEFKVFDPYHIALFRGFQQIHFFLKLTAPEQLNKELHFVFEKRGYTDDKSLSQAYRRILVQGSLFGNVSVNNFSQFRLELMSKNGNSTGLQISDLTARPIGNYYLHQSGQKLQTDHRVIDIIKKKLCYCTADECSPGTIDIVHQTLGRKGKKF